MLPKDLSAMRWRYSGCHVKPIEAKSYAAVIDVTKASPRRRQNDSIMAL